MRTQLDAVAAYEGMANVFKLKGDGRLPRRVAASCCPATGRKGRAAPRREHRAGRGVLAADSRTSTTWTSCSRRRCDACEELFGFRTRSSCWSTRPASGCTPSRARASHLPARAPRCGSARAHRRRGGAEAVGARHAHEPRALVLARGTRSPRRARAGGASSGSSRCRSLHAAQSQLVAPMLAHRKLVGVLCLQSEAPGAFQSRGRVRRGHPGEPGRRWRMAALRRADAASRRRDGRATGRGRGAPGRR